MRVYISGQVSGLPRADVERNFARGHRLLIANGKIPVNPLDYVSINDTPADAMAVLLPILLHCNGILLLNSWEFSEGAKIEYALAHYARLKIIKEEDIT